MAGGYYRTGDIGSRDEDGYITYVGPRRRRLQGLRLQDLARSSWRAPCWSTRRSPRPPSCPRPTRCGWPCRRRTSCWRRAGSPGRDTAKVALRALPGGPRPVQAHPPAGVRRTAQDRLRQDPPDRAARAHGRGHRHRVRRGGPASEQRASPTRTAPAPPPCSATPSARNLDRAIAAWPDREALVDVASGRRWTYAEFGADVDELAPRADGVRGGEGRPGRHLGGQLPRVGAASSTPPPASARHGQHQPRLPGARAGVRPQPGRGLAC